MTHPQPLVVHHMAALDGWPFPPNSLEAIRACLDANAPFIEIDVTALREDDYLLVHDPVLDSETSGSGAVGATSPADAKTYFITHNRQATAYHTALLSEVVALFLEVGGTARLQVDFKNVLPMGDDEPLRRLAGLLEPLGDRALVSTGADWHLRRLHTFAPWLNLGLDIGFYLDYRPTPVDPRLPPFREGAYGYSDDHILGAMRGLETPAYLAERCDILRRMADNVSIWYVNYRTIARFLDDGFNLAAWLHDYGVKLDAWTLDAGAPAAAHVATLRDAGVDLFTSNTPAALQALLLA